MGCFTWTLANKKTRFNKYDDFADSCKLQYGGRGVIVCPDNTHIVENYYDGYGIFDGHDVYELVVDWNRNHLTTIIEKIKEKEGENFWGNYLIPLMIAYEHNDKDLIEQEVTKLSKKYPYMKNDWKRNIGITIACTHNDMLPYPIKIVDNKSHFKSYEKLGISESTQ